MQILWSPIAVEDIEEISRHIDQQSPGQAATVVRRLVAAVESLVEFPRRGRVVPEVGNDNVRELVVRPFRVVYRIRDSGIEVVAILRSTRQLPRERF